MGCVTSKTDINDLHPNIFQVMNVDEMCNPLQPGQLEVNETDLVLHQRGKTPVRWPLKSLRRYGFDAQLFSFECGRRCPTGPGIYAFKCSRTEQLFNLLQTQMRNNPGEDAVSNSMDFTPRQTESNYLEPAPVQLRQNGNRFSLHNGRLGSVGSSSNGPLSPLTTSPSPPPPPPPSNNNCETEDKHRTMSLSEVCSPPPVVLTTYANIDITPTSPPAVDGDPSGLSSPVYMNVIPGQEVVVPALPTEPPPRPQSKLDLDLEERHCYANLEPGELESLRGMERYPPSTPPPQQINYILLDLDQTSSSSSLTGAPNQPTSPVTLTSASSLTPESPNKPSEGYATIDFNRTVALCAVSCPLVEEEGSRKTRHNSTMGDLTTVTTTTQEVRRTRHNSTISELMAPLASRLSSSLSE
uniref:IRS-type PTB domain-containing protein n=2 Tax=Proconiini TaxID=565685 RepID=A0A1B6ETL1_9HEMI